MFRFIKNCSENILRAIKNIIRFYLDGFRSMTVGKTLWIIILIKLFILFAVLKIFFFPDFLKSRFDTDVEKGNYVLEELSNP
ncbi:MAG: DUF4492 domain-containing protein [Bacteroidales bacterium]|nr:DUF4492 domain-containing protein [Bacteroidales bacterium]